MRILSLGLILSLKGAVLHIFSSEANDVSEPAAIRSDVPPSCFKNFLREAVVFISI